VSPALEQRLARVRLRRAGIPSHRFKLKELHRRVGFIGIGHMRRGMALSLIRAGHDVTPAE
jgi:hypothetical protein